MKKPFFRKVLLGAAAFLLMLGGYALAADPGSESDPVVTKSWVEQYVTETLTPIEKDLSQLKEDMESAWPGVYLWIGSTTAEVFGEETTLATAPYVESGSTMVPLRFVGEALGAEVKWDNVTKTATYIKGNETVAITIGQKEITVDGERQAISVAAVLKNNQTMVPIRVLSEALGARVSWDNTEKKVTVRP